MALETLIKQKKDLHFGSCHAHYEQTTNLILARVNYLFELYLSQILNELIA